MRGIRLLRTRFRGQELIGPLKSPSIVLNLQSWTIFKDLAKLHVDSHRNHVSHKLSNLANGKIVLLCEERELSHCWNWSKSAAIKPPSHLWRFHWHYQEFLLSHVADSQAKHICQNELWGVVWSILQTWIELYSPERTCFKDDAWHPYCISRRVPVWLTLLRLGTPPEPLREALLSSIGQQANFLAENLEYDLGGNHLLENLTTLALVDITLKTPKSSSRLKQTMSILTRELERQVLLHGEHFERSPVYHCQVLANVLRLLCLSIDDETCAQRLRDTARRMISFLAGILHPDGEVPLFADSVFYESPSVAQIRELTELAGFDWPILSNQALTINGPYHIFRTHPNSASIDSNTDSMCLIADFGQVGASHLPAHAHCDLLNLELSINDNRWITDSGNFDYEDSTMRAFCRSSLAHNVMTIDMVNHCDVWGKFRMGQRGRILKTKTGEYGRYRWSSGVHDSYRALGVKTMGRMIAVGAEGNVCVADWSECTDPNAREMVGLVHFAPKIEIEMRRGLESHFILRHVDSTRQIQFFNCDQIRIANSWHCAAFGFRERRMALMYFNRTNLDVPCGWVLGSPDEPCLVKSTASGVTLRSPNLLNPLFEWKR